MELCSLHPLDLEVVAGYVAALRTPDGGRSGPATVLSWEEQTLAAARRGYASALQGLDSGLNALTFGLAQLLTSRHPSFVFDGLALTTWEARIDRGIGMLLRPPSRLFADAGLEPALARRLPIRLDLGYGTMGGAYVPHHLVPQLERLLNARAERTLRRMAEAGYDAIPVLSLFLDACVYARERGLGLYEAIDVVAPALSDAVPPGMLVYRPDRKQIDPARRRRLERAVKAGQPPGLMTRLFAARRRAAADLPHNGRSPDG